MNFVDPGRLSDRVESFVLNRGERPSCERPFWLREVGTREELAWNEPYRRHVATHTADGHKDSDTPPGQEAWVTRFPEPLNDKDYIVWTLDESRKLRLMCLRNGWTRNERTYQGIGRLKRVRIEGIRYVDGKPVELPGKGCHRRVTLKGQAGLTTYQTVHLNCKTAYVRLTIRSVHPGQSGFEYDGMTYASAVGLSDVLFYH